MDWLFLSDFPKGFWGYPALSAINRVGKLAASSLQGGVGWQTRGSSQHMPGVLTNVRAAGASSDWLVF